jgi:hypothetical protein
MEGLDFTNVDPEIGFRDYLEWGEQIYHTPFDDLNQGINYDAVRQHVRILFAFTYEVSNTYVEPQWIPGSVYMNARLQSIAEER